MAQSKAATFTFKLSFGILAALVFCFIVYNGYQGHRIWKHRHHTVLVKRYVDLTIQQITFVFILQLDFLFLYICLAAEQDLKTTTWAIVIEFTWTICSLLNLWVGVARFWLLYYDMRWLNACYSERWHQIIRPNSKSIYDNNGSKFSLKMIDDPTWFTEHKATYGNFKYLKIYIYSIGTISAIAAYCFGSEARTAHHDENLTLEIISRFFEALFCGIPGLCVAFLYYQVWFKLKFEDNFFVGLELKYLFVLLAFEYTAFLLFIPYDPIFFEDTDTISRILKCAAVNFFWMLVVFASFQCKTTWVLYKIAPLLSDPRLNKSRFDSRSKITNGISGLGGISGFAGKGSFLGSGIHTSVHNSGIGSPVSALDSAVAIHRHTDTAQLELAMMPLLELQITKDLNLENTAGRGSKTSTSGASGGLGGKGISLHNDIKSITLGNVLSHSKSLDLLMQQLGREFSMECLLSLIEFIQYQNYVWRYLNNFDIFDGEKLAFLEKKKLISHKYGINLPDNIPKSSIVHPQKNVDIMFDVENNAHLSEKHHRRGKSKIGNPNNDDRWVHDCKIKVYELYLKYIALGSDNEINISFRTRRSLIRLMKKKDIWMNNDTIDEETLFTIFNPSSVEMYQLIHGTLARFKNSHHFRKLHAVITQ